MITEEQQYRLRILNTTIAERVKQAFKEKEWGVREVAGQLRASMNLEESAAYQYIGDIRNGYTFLTPHRRKTTEKRLEYLTLLCYALDISAGDTLITRLQSVVPELTYPPNTQVTLKKQERIKPERKKKNPVESPIEGGGEEKLMTERREEEKLRMIEQYYSEGYTRKEIASEMQIPELKVSMYLSKHEIERIAEKRGQTKQEYMMGRREQRHMRMYGEISRAIQEGLKSQGIGQRELAERVGVCVQSINLYLHMKVRPREETLQKIYEVLNISKSRE